MSANALLQEGVESDTRAEASPDCRILLDLLETTRLGLLLVSGRNDVVACTSNARRHLERSDVRIGERVSNRQLVRALASRSGQTVAAVIDGLRSARRRSAAYHATVQAGSTRVGIELRFHGRTGWVAIFDEGLRHDGATAAVAELARVDPLVVLPDRRSVRERLSEIIESSRASDAGCAVLLVNLARFKPVNDSLGSAVGDLLLAKVEDRLRSTLAPTDIVGRMGGDEFVVLRSSAARLDAEGLAARIVDLIGRTYVLDGNMLNIGADVGIALAPHDGLQADVLLRRADLALHRAKEDGRGSFCFFAPEMDAKIQASRALETDLRRALARREFKLFYQPQLSLADDRLVGCEALIRWFHPERGQVSPLDFIPLAEEIGLIGPIGEWVIRQACCDAASWPKAIKVAVNVSPVQFKENRLIATVLSALASSGLAAERLEIEITEGVLLQNDETTIATLHQLRQLGVQISMDDFGTGYSSLSTLRSFPFSKIKIDRSFVRDMTEKPDGDAVIRAVSSLGRSLGMATVAEGVETAEQMERIRAQGCTEVQGYLISKPVPSPELAALIGGGRDWSRPGLSGCGVAR